MKNQYCLNTGIFIALALGIMLGILINLFARDNLIIQNYFVQGLFYVLGGIFVNVLKMLVVPLVMFSIVSGVCGIADVKALGRIGIKTMLWYLITTTLAITLAILIAIWVNPGKNLQLPENTNFALPELPPVTDTLINLIPYNPFAAFAEGNILQIIFFAAFFAIGLRMLGEAGGGLTESFEKLNGVMMKLVEIVMSFAPAGLFFLMAKAFAEQGFELIMPMLSFCGVVIFALALHTFGVLSVFLIGFAKLDPRIFFKKILPVQFFAFSTAGSNATIPVTLQILEQSIGIKKSMMALTIPLGANISMEGTVIMQGVATVFIANVYGVDLDLTQYLTVIGVIIPASLGTAGIPGGGLMMLAMVLHKVDLPVEGVGLIVALGRLPDMLRTVVNVTGDAVVTCIVARSENAIDDRIFNLKKSVEGAETRSC